MPKRIYVGNLPFNCDRAKLEQLFSAYGAVETVNLPPKRSGGFGFVEFKDPKAGAEAMRALKGVSFEGQRLMITDRETG